MPKARYHHGDLKTAILDAAEVLIGDRPIEMVSMRELAREAGVSPGAPYHHFNDRSGLILAMAQRGFARLNDALIERRADGRAGLIDGYLAFATGNPALYQLMFSPEATMGANAQELEPFAKPVSDLLMTDLALQRPDLDTDGLGRLSATVWCFMHGVATLGLASPLKVKLGTMSLSAFARDGVERIVNPQA